MDENYTCVCGHEEFYIHDDSTISCGGCGRRFGLICEGNFLETAIEFNKRIKKEYRT